MPSYYRSPIGLLEITTSYNGLAGITLVKRRTKQRPVIDQVIIETLRQLDEYFSGSRAQFSVPLDIQQGTPFQQQVWRALLEIPYAATMTYAALARSIGIPRAAQAVGQAVKVNPIAIVVPCHRVVPATGGIGGFAWGSQRKDWLLKHEHQNRPTELTVSGPRKIILDVKS